MDDFQFNQHMNKKKRDDDRFPRQSDVDNIMSSLPRRKTLQKRPFFYISSLAAACLLFIITTLGIINQPGDEADLREYYEQEKEKFEESLGVEKTEMFYEVERAEEIVQSFDGDPDSIAFHDAKERIDDLLTTPVQYANEQNLNDQNIRVFTEDILGFFGMFQPSMQEWWNEQTVSVNWETADIAALRSEDSTGKDQVNDAIQTLHDQGYRILVKGEGSDFLVVPDYPEIRNLIDYDFDEWMYTYAEAMDQLQPSIAPFDQYEKDEWKEMWGDVETVIHAYNSSFEWTYTFMNPLRSHMEALLMLGLEEGETIPENTRREFHLLIEENAESPFVPILRDAYYTYQESDWQRIDLNQDMFSVMLDILDGEIEYNVREVDRIESGGLWLLNEEEQEAYEALSFAGLSPKEVLRIMIQSVRDQNTEALNKLSRNMSFLEVDPVLSKLAQDPANLKYYLTDEKGERITYHFVTREDQLTITFQLSEDNWILTDIRS
ncbi:hypothetical protein EQV77_09800 [Halobacillus fulvus]|nr:hypothetical protein EQV77_09800 [Halobacillus fulvus]